MPIYTRTSPSGVCVGLCINELAGNTQATEPWVTVGARSSLDRREIYAKATHIVTAAIDISAFNILL